MFWSFASQDLIYFLLLSASLLHATNVEANEVQKKQEEIETIKKVPEKQEKFIDDLPGAHAGLVLVTRDKKHARNLATSDVEKVNDSGNNHLESLPLRHGDIQLDRRYGSKPGGAFHPVEIPHPFRTPPNHLFPSGHGHGHGSGHGSGQGYGIPKAPLPPLNPQPPCAKDGSPYCLYDQEYPYDHVMETLSIYGNEVEDMYHQIHHYTYDDFLKHDNYTHAYRHGGHFICESEVSYIRPGWARNFRGNWVAVLNTDRFPQSIRIETCKYPESRCDYIPPCFVSSCRQRYTYVKLMCLNPYDPSERPALDVFRVPSDCSCFVHDTSLFPAPNRPHH
ncbi:unnamed protein product [Darwinula stevensoni]|uniref:Spaetzle domain-containing protein n=1 Tax=Darwinula stevensoni TaxID=69355 RepID=A0A7R9A083_9CRUS|nr:unnamed protein product [Darwinula stevensoni]CAG0884096.1 unnamed protein product [Darwinula stevensoni]